MQTNSYENDDFEEYSSDSFDEYIEDENELSVIPLAASSGSIFNSTIAETVNDIQRESRIHAQENKYRIRKIISSLKLQSFVAYYHKHIQDNNTRNTNKTKTKHCQTDGIIKKEAQIQCDDDIAATLDMTIMACKNNDYKQLWNIKHNNSITKNLKETMKPFINSSRFPLFIEQATSILEGELLLPNVVISNPSYIDVNQSMITKGGKDNEYADNRSCTKSDSSWKKILIHKKIIQLFSPITLQNQNTVISVHVDSNELTISDNENIKWHCKGCICIWQKNNIFDIPSKIIIAGSGSIFTRSCLAIPEKNLVLCGTRDGDIQLWNLLTIHPKDRHYCGNIINGDIIHYTTPTFQTDLASTDYATFHSTIHTSPIVQLAILPHSIDGNFSQSKNSVDSKLLLLASLDTADVMMIWSLVYCSQVYDKKNKNKHQQDDLGKKTNWPGYKLIKLRRIERGQEIVIPSPLLTSLNNSHGTTTMRNSKISSLDCSVKPFYASCLGIYFFPFGEEDNYGSNTDVHYLIATSNGYLEHRTLYADSILPKIYITYNATENMQSTNSVVEGVDFSPFVQELFLVCLSNYSVLLFHERCSTPMLSWDFSFFFLQKSLPSCWSSLRFTSVQWSLSFPAVFFIMIHGNIFVIDLTLDRTDPVYHDTIDIDTEDKDGKVINNSSDFIFLENENNVRIITSDAMNNDIIERELGFSFSDERKEMIHDEIAFVRDFLN